MTDTSLDPEALAQRIGRQETIHDLLVPGAAPALAASLDRPDNVRIHDDAPYATRVEGYPALVVHGPLIATLLADLVSRERPDGRWRSFEFKALRPCFAGQPLVAKGDPSPDGVLALWAEDPKGRRAMQATAVIETQELQP